MNEEIKDQLLEMNAALADLVEGAQAIGTALAARKPDLPAPINVAPAQVTVNQPTNDWVTVFKYDRDGRVVEARTTRVAKN